MIKPVSANFIQSASSISNSPDFAISEIAFLGRSNVGKSSFINALVNQKSLAKSSQTPGKTQLINFFDVKFKDDEKDEIINSIFVDLPGIGYAKVSKKIYQFWQKNLDQFLKERSSIRLFVHLIDSRQFDLDIDKNLNDYLLSFLRPDQRIINFYTKSDKLNQSMKSKVLQKDKNAHFISVLNNIGINEARETIVKQVLGF